MRRIFWKEEQIQEMKRLMDSHTSTQVGNIFGTTKNAILGVLYRDKIKKGYVPPLNSPYARIKKNYPTHLFKTNYWLLVYPMLIG